MSDNWTERDVPSQRGRVAVITGANTGLGFEAARVLAAKGARVLLACRDEGKAQAAMAAIAAEGPTADLGFVPLDQGDLASVRTAAAQAAAEPRLDVLLNNAGVMVPPLSYTKDGFEQQFGVNHLGTFALTGLLLPKLAETAGSRVVITASLAHRQKTFRFDDLGARTGYSPSVVYGQSKLANMLFLFELDKRLRAAGSPVIAVGCHPGVAATELMRHSRVMAALNPVFRRVLNTPAMGAWPSLLAAVGPVTPGGYYGPQKFLELRGPAGEATRNAAARDPELARQLWEVSVEMTGVDPGI